MTKKELEKIDKLTNPKVSPYKDKIDVTKTYIIPMRSRKARIDKNSVAVPTECNIKLVDRAVFVTTPGYTHYIFVDSEFVWHLHTGYIKIKEEGVNEEN